MLTSIYLFIEICIRPTFLNGPANINTWSLVTEGENLTVSTMGLFYVLHYWFVLEAFLSDAYEGLYPIFLLLKQLLTCVFKNKCFVTINKTT
jgi:hypothetical protein